MNNMDYGLSYEAEKRERSASKKHDRIRWASGLVLCTHPTSTFGAAWGGHSDVIVIV